MLRLSQMDEFRTDIRGDGVDLLRKFSDQTGKKRGRVFRRSFSHLPISVFGDLLDGEEDRNAEDVAGTERTTLRTPRNSGRLSWLFRITLMSIIFRPSGNPLSKRSRSVIMPTT